jgi:hypothetical protein
MHIAPLHAARSAAALAIALLVGLIALLAPAAAAEPGGRAYELVSHPEMWGQRVTVPDKLTTAFSYGRIEDPSTSGEFAALDPVSGDGEVVLYGTVLPIPGFPTRGLGDVFRAKRTEDGWVTEYVGPSDTRGGTFVDWKPDLGQLYWRFEGAPFDPADTDPPLPVGAGYQDLYRREADGSFTWLNQPALSPVPEVEESVRYGGSSADGSHVVFGSSRQLTADAPPSDTSANRDPVALYEHVGDVTRLVTVKPGGGAFTLGPEDLRFRNAFGGISTDGSRIVFEARIDSSTPADVWVRVNGTTTLEASRSRLSTPDSPQRAHFEAMSSDGARVVFVTAERLIEEDQDSSADLYAYDVSSDSLELVSVGGPGQGNSDACSNPVLAKCNVEYVNSTADASLVYFVSAEQLAGAEGLTGQLNLYVRSLEDGTTELVATLVNADWAIVGTSGELDDRSRVTSDGSKLLFESAANLTDYDAAGRRQVYIYDAGSGELECASCRPDGDPPSAPSHLITPEGLLDGQASEARNGASRFAVPNATSDGSKVFFETAERLVEDDINSQLDVYEYDVEANEVRLISAGRGSEAALYFGNSADGRDVFFLSVERLVPEAINGTVMKLYDARVGGGFEAPPPEVPCGPGDCQGEPTPPPGELEPGSGSYSGPGNPTAEAPGCGRLERKAKRLRVRAKRLNRKARRADGVRQKSLRRRARRARLEARQATRELRACKRGERR